MRLKTSFRLSVTASLATVVVLALLMAWSIRAASRANEARDVAVALQQEINERAGLRSEYLLYRSERAADQWTAKSARLVERLELVAARFEGADDRAVIAEMAELTRRGNLLIGEIVDMGRASEAAGTEPASTIALRERLTSKLVLLVYELSSRAARLVDSTARRADRTVQMTNVLVFVLIGAVLAMVVAHALLTSRLIERRLARLRDGAERISSGSLSHRIGLAGNDELAELGQAFDGMAAALERHVTQLQESNRELEAFSYSVSHDLRAPLRHITGFVDLLGKRAHGALDEKSHHYLRVISESATNMGKLIDDLLAFSRMSRAELMPERVELRPLVDAVIRDLRAEVDGRQVTWAVADLPEVSGDAAMLRQVWFNLVANALKFSRPRAQARIEIGAVRADGELLCFVRDNGVGFDMEYAHNLFGVFQRLHRAEEFEGNGVGLANVQRIVHRHGGRVWAEGVPDRGAAFWFSLPMKEIR